MDRKKTIGKNVLISKSNVVAIVDVLENLRFVKRKRDQVDRRHVSVHITQKGRDLVERILPGHVSAIAEEMGYLSNQEQDELARLCRKLGLKSE